jgi:hypothetical protein
MDMTEAVGMGMATEAVGMGMAAKAARMARAAEVAGMARAAVRLVKEAARRRPVMVAAGAVVELLLRYCRERIASRPMTAMRSAS